jgi:hypothetical protein
MAEAVVGRALLTVGEGLRKADFISASVAVRETPRTS